MNQAENIIDFSLFSEAGINASEERIREILKQFDLFQGCDTRDEMLKRLRELRHTIVF